MKNIKQRAIILALLNLGIVSILAQVLLIRELIIAFYGNELFISLVLAFWLIATGLGSLWLAKLFHDWQERNLLWLHLIIPIVLISAIILARLARLVLAEPGVMPNFIWSTLWSILIIMPIGLLAGLLFVVLVRNIKLVNDQAVTLAYIIESLGFFIGAFLFNFILYQLVGFSLLVLIAIFCFFIVLLLSFHYFWRQAVIVAIFIILLASSLSQTSIIDQHFYQWLFPKQDLLTSINSQYGTVQVSRIGEQVNFYYNGHILDHSQNNYHNELMVHLPMLLVDQAKNVLVIGNAFTGIIDEINKYKIEKIVYLELDKDYLELGQKYLEMNWPDNLQIINQDARTYLNTTDQSFDVVIINYANPSTLAENRYFTQEFFSLVNSHLSKQAYLTNESRQGIVVIKINTTPNYTVGAQNQLLTSLYQTLNHEFNHVVALPENEVIYLASEEIDYNLDILNQKYQEFNLTNQYLFPEYIDWRFTNDRTEMLNQQLAAAGAKINSDFKPTLYYQQLKIFMEKMQIKKWYILISIIIFILIIWLLKIVCKLKIENWKLLTISAIPEFCLISFEVLLILLFQTFHGYLYTQLSLIIALVLVGIALGSLVARKLLEIKDTQQILKISYLIIFITFVIPLIISWQWEFIFNFKLFYYLISLLAAFAIGTKFPVINKLYLKNSQNLGAIYGIDLIGGAIGALLAGILMLPVLGVVGSLGVVVGLGGLASTFLLLKQ